jgi:ERCC4-type nuclease
MSSVCRILADTFERRSLVIDELRHRGVEVEIRRLPVADFDLASGILVERKTVADFHVSLERGRLWRQVAELRDHARLPYLLVEGRDLDAGSVAGNSIRGACLAVIGQGVPIIASSDPGDSAAWLHLLALRGNGTRLARDRPAYAQRLKPQSDQVNEAMLAAVPGISVAGARALLDQFGSVAEVVNAGYDAWLQVRGIGSGRGRALEEAIN